MHNKKVIIALLVGVIVIVVFILAVVLLSQSSSTESFGLGRHNNQIQNLGKKLNSEYTQGVNALRDCNGNCVDKCQGNCKYECRPFRSNRNAHGYCLDHCSVKCNNGCNDYCNRKKEGVLNNISDGITEEYPRLPDIVKTGWNYYNQDIPSEDLPHGVVPAPYGHGYTIRFT